MQLPWQTVEIGDYAFDAPAAVVAGRLHRFGSETWHSGEAWQDTLSQLPETPSGFVLPLEVSAQGHAGQDLLGYTLLVHLRFGAPPGLAGLPVLVTAWQPLEDVLRRQPDLLIVAPAVEYHTMLEARQRLAGFIADVSSGTVSAASQEQIEEAAHGGGGQAARASYHDLANEYYAAHRIWTGYTTLLASATTKKRANAAVTRRLESAAAHTFSWEADLETKLRSPLVRRFQAQRAHRPVPRYPIVEGAEALVAAHADNGLPSGMRVLLVDDEFDKGVADVLLPVLFHESDFTRRLKHEWVYAEPDDDGVRRWARFVCVRDVARAWYWLAYWETTDRQLSPDRLSRRRWLEALTPEHRSLSWATWLTDWDKALSPERWQQRQGSRTPEDVFGNNRDFQLDQHSAGPRAKSTAVMLDLRLQKLAAGDYAFRDLPSYWLRRSVKAYQPDIPVIMFTASRQILNLAEILESASELDGWFIKEGPDIPRDPSNSANAVAYLLDRLHLYSTLRGWYRRSFEWSIDRKREFGTMFNSPRREEVLADVSRSATDLFRRILARDATDAHAHGQKFKGWVNARVPKGPFPVARTLVARRVAVAALLWTCDVEEGGLVWNAPRFADLLPGDTGDNVIVYASDKVNFNEALWLRQTNILSQLLVDELDWLLSVDWPADKSADILGALRSEKESIE